MYNAENPTPITTTSGSAGAPAPATASVISLLATPDQ